MTIGMYRFKDRGPTNSREYNERMRETSESLLDLLGRVTAAEADVRALSSLTAIEHVANSHTFESLSAQLEMYQQRATDNVQNVKYCTVYDSTCVVRNDINGNVISDQLSWEGDSGLVVLPYTDRTSKLGFSDPNGSWIVDPGVKMAYLCTYADGGNTIDAVNEVNELIRAIDHNQSTAFLVRTPPDGGTSRTLTLYVSVPAESAAGALVNYIEIDPAPRADLNLVRVYYATKPGAALDDDSDATQWKDLWISDGIDRSKLHRYLPPREAEGNNDAIVQQACGPRRYYFGERRVTAIKVVLEATGTHTIDTGEEYFLGIRHLDVGHVTFGKTGRLVFEYAMPTGVKQVTAVTTRVVNPGTDNDGIEGIGTNMPELTLFYKDGATWYPYTMGTLVNKIDALRIETSMSQAPNGCTPVLVGFDIKYAR